MSEEIAKIGKYILKKNELRSKRNRARSKAGYYKRILNSYNKKLSIEEAKARGIRGFSAWKKPGKKSELLLLYKKYKLEQIQAEIEMHELVLFTRKQLANIRRKIPFKQITNYSSRTYAIMLTKSFPEFGIVLNLKQLQEIMVNQDIEDILLDGKNPNRF